MVVEMEYPALEEAAWAVEVVEQQIARHLQEASWAFEEPWELWELDFEQGVDWLLARHSPRALADQRAAVEELEWAVQRTFAWGLVQERVAEPRPADTLEFVPVDSFAESLKVQSAARRARIAAC